MTSNRFACLAAAASILFAARAHAAGPAVPTPVPAAPPSAAPPGSAPPAGAPAPSLPPGYAAPGYAPPGYAPPGYAPQGYAPPGYAPQGYAQGWGVPGDATVAYVPMKRRSSGMIAGGIILISLGSVGLIAGAGMFAGGSKQQFSSSCNADFSVCTNSTAEADTTMKYGGIADIVLGIVATGVGIPLLVIGSAKVPDRGEASAALPSFRVGPGGGALAWRF